jgi:proline dehydrogenase
MITAPWKPLLRRAARSYVVGPDLEDALQRARAFAAQGVPASTLCFWDGPEDAPRHVADQYVAAVRSIAYAQLDSYVSIKAPSLGFDAGLVADIVEAACEGGGVRIHFDSLGAETVDRTFGLIEQACAFGCPLGCTIPGRWRRSRRDAEVAAGMGLRIRVVKGQWPDAGGAIDPHRGFLDIVDAIAGSAAPVAVATHEPGLAAEAIRRLQAAGTPCEMELLFGLPSKAALNVSRELGVPVRYYLPYGHAWLPYALRQARRDPRILWWVLRDASSLWLLRDTARN